MMILLASAALALPPATANWTNLTTSPVKIDCTDDTGRKVCRSTGVIGVPVATAVATFAELDKHQAKMEKISRIVRLEADTLYVVMDYPGMLSDRSYVARFTRRTDADGTEVFAWVPVVHAGAPDDGTVRLTWLEGEWRFKSEGSNTRVTYVWDADPGGNLPDASLVYKQAGRLAVQDMANACGTAIVSP
jgi:hypothetical protein